MRKYLGFSLIELLTVIIIMGFIAAFAIPAYQNYLIQSKISEGLALAESPKNSVNEYYNTVGSLPASSSSATGFIKGLSATGAASGSKYVSNIIWTLNTSTQGWLQITFNSSTELGTAASKNLLLVAEFTNPSTTGALTWRCVNPGAAGGTFASITGMAKSLAPVNCNQSTS